MFRAVLSGAKRAKRVFGQLIRAAKDTRPATQEVADQFKADTERAFQTETAPDGRPWAKLAPFTLAERARLGFSPGPILQRTGASGARDSVRHSWRTRVTRLSAELYTDHPHAGKLHRGFTTRFGAIVPARSQIGQSRATGRQVLKAFGRHFRRALS